MPASEQQPITGRRRQRKTSRAVVIGERVARSLITVGGIGTIVAVITIFGFLLWVVLPLFTGAEAEALPPTPRAPVEASAAVPWHVGVDEYQCLAWALQPDGTLSCFRLDDGSELLRRKLFGEQTPTAFHATLRDAYVAFGFADGTVRLGNISFATRFLGAQELTPEIQALAQGARLPWGEGLLERLPDDRFRLQELSVSLDEPVAGGTASPVLLLTHARGDAQTLLTVLKADGTLTRSEVRRRTNLLTGAVTTKLLETVLPFEPALGRPAPRFLAQSERGDSIVLAWEDGLAQRFDVRDSSAPYLAETLQLLPEPDSRLLALQPLIGSTTLVAGDDQGRVSAWFPARAPGSDTLRLTRAHELPRHAAPVSALSASQRNRVLAVGFADGVVQVVHVTSGELLTELNTGGDPLLALALSPRGDGLLGVGQRTVHRWQLDAPHPETTLTALFTPVWYEGAGEPAHVWQSSSGTDDFEPKLGVWPLVFGTLKASLYSLIFSLPIALLAALYTSEFLSRQARARIKPSIELMASLPSVVLGFLAAIVVAPVIEQVVPQTLAAFAAIPFCFVAGAYLWQLLPQSLSLRLAGWPRFLAMVAAIGAGLLLARALGPLVERTWFSGDLMAWLDGQVGNSVGGWMFLTLPGAVLVVAVLRGRLVAPWVRSVAARWSRERSALFDLGLFVVTALAAFLLARSAAGLLDGLGFDPRGGYLGTYVQRNAMIVGFLTGFAVIPIIYTLAEDALSSVPDHLRAASLAAGATPWQTAVRVVVPTAMSGVFSAVMVGVGRVVGETMIVLMAAGNTPVLDWNLFNGFRTLSATIAVELPEAVQDGTLYRVLFLAALTLFAMTFVINTIAEVVRLRFRRRAYEL
ncbi:MAG: ABC transporter permease subunit [Planctomycetota bacterium]